MAPQEQELDYKVEENEERTNSHFSKKEDIPKLDPNWKYDFAYPYLIFMVSLHVLSLIGLYYGLTGSLKWQSYLFTFIWFQIAQIGFNVGNHRYFCHRSFKAKLPLRIFLMLASASSFTGANIKWTRDHRQHHKYSDTEADPYNSRRGFMYSHLGWVTHRKSAFVRDHGKTIDMSDALNDPVQVFQLKYYWILMPLLTFILPTFIPMYFWNEGFMQSYFFCTIFRQCLFLNMSGFVNSWAHRFGNKPYDKAINPADHKFVSFLSGGESFHNFHHTFPFDSRSSELPHYFLSVANIFIDFMEMIGQAYDAKRATPELVAKRSARTGDGTRYLYVK